MESSVEVHDGIAILSLSGKLNMAAAPSLRQLVEATVEAGHPRISVDLAAVDFIDSSGLGALISGLKTCRQAGGDLRIAAPTEQVMLVLRLTNLDRMLTPYPDPRTAYTDD